MAHTRSAMGAHRWPSTVNGRLLFFTLIAFVLVSSGTMAASTRRIRQGKLSDPYNQYSNNLPIINQDDYSLTENIALPAQIYSKLVNISPTFVNNADSMETPAETFKVPKRTLSLFTRWKTLEQLRRNHLHPPVPLASSAYEPPASPRKKNPPSSKVSSHKEEMVALPSLSGDFSLSARAIQRSLRPPGQPLRWG